MSLRRTGQLKKFNLNELTVFGMIKEKNTEVLDMKTEKEVDMGGTFDYFGELSHPDYTDITEEQYANRMILREAMLNHGFKPLDEEWWHFTLEDEPYPDTYFTFPINSDSVKSE